MQGLLLALLCTGSAAEGAEADRGDVCLTDRTCKDLYKRARALSQTGQLNAATVLYREAYKRREAAWLLLNLGRVLQRQGKLDEAIATYEQYLRTPHPEHEARISKAREYLALAQKERAARPLAAPPVEPPASESPAGAAAPPTESEPPPEIESEPPPAPLRVDPAVGAPPQVSPLAAVPARSAISSQPRETGLRQRLDRGFFIGMGVSGAMLVATAVTGSLALSGSAQLQRAQYVGSPGTDLQDLQAQTHALAISTDVLLGSAAAALVVGVAITFGRKRLAAPLSAHGQLTDRGFELSRQ